MSLQQDIRTAADKVIQQQADTAALHAAYRNSSPAAYLSADAAAALNRKLQKLQVNYPRLIVQTYAERLQVKAFRRLGSTEPDLNIWRQWRRAGMTRKADLAHLDRGLYGAAYVTTWGHAANSARPVVLVDSPRSAAVDLDPATGEVRSMVRFWREGQTMQAAYMTEEATYRYEAKGSSLDGAVQWTRLAEAEHGNPWGIIPTVPLIRQASSTDLKGTSAVADVVELGDALAKIIQDSLVTSEYHSRPRRWATGLEIQEDDDGNPIDPFGDERLMQSEDPDTKFGQLPAADLDGYSDLTALLTQQIGALSGLPAHYLGLHGDQPPNAEGVKAAETQLVMRTRMDQRQLGDSWAEVAAWIDAIAAGRSPADDVVTDWETAEISTPSANADSAQKLHGMGVPLKTLLREPLGYEPHEVNAIARGQLSELAQRNAVGGRNAT